MPKARNSERLSCQFNQRIIPKTPVTAGSPFPLMNHPAMVSDVMTNLKKQSDGKLRNRIRSIGWNVTNRNLPLRCRFNIHNVISCSQYSDILHLRACIQYFLCDRRFIRNHRFRIPYSLRRPLQWCAFINNTLPQFFKSFPTQIARILRISI